jgi:hypothetical protein
MKLFNKFLRWLKGEVITINLDKGTATLMRDGIVVVKQDGCTDGVPLWLCRQELINKFEAASENK